MEERQLRVVSAASPFVLRSAIHETFKDDPRFRSFLLPAGESIAAFCDEVGAEVVVLSEVVDLPEVTSVILHLDPLRIEMRIRGVSFFFPYADLKSLADFLWLNKNDSAAAIRSRAGPVKGAREPLPAGGMESQVKEGGP